MEKYKQLYRLWLDRIEDATLRSELECISDDDEAILDRFYKDLEFGTGGLRGVIGAGTNRMNIYTVGRATQGFADYLNSVSEHPSVAIAYDSRINSDVFSRTAASVFAANGIKVYIYKRLAPTPMLSYAVRALCCDGGVVITASHNPSKYNGYKAYGPDGCQLGLDASNRVIDNVGKVDIFDGVKKVDFDKALEDGRISYVPDSVIQSYYENVMAQRVNPAAIKEAGLKIIYTPLHGTGNIPVRTILDKIGVKDVTIVPEQEKPDGNFPTAPYPNPEIRQPFELALKMAETVCPDLLMATDPDCDRIGIAVRNGEDYVLMSGNEVGALMMNYLLSQRKANGTLPKDPVAVKTIVTTRICDRIAAKYGCKIIDVLTGFKFIGEQIGLLENNHEEDRYIFGFEESYGYLAGSYVRDKDAVFGSMMVCEMASFYKLQGKSLLDVMNDLYAEFGVFRHSQLSFTFEGAEGMTKMAGIMQNLRENPPKSLADMTVTKINDYERSVSTDVATSATEKIDLPSSNVLEFVLTDGASVIVRPSGTEPKIKAYITACAGDKAAALALEEKLSDDVKTSFGF